MPEECRAAGRGLESFAQAVVLGLMNVRFMALTVQDHQGRFVKDVMRLDSGFCERVGSKSIRALQEPEDHSNPTLLLISRNLPCTRFGVLAMYLSTPLAPARFRAHFFPHDRITLTSGIADEVDFPFVFYL
jgi:hypothetical protein